MGMFYPFNRPSSIGIVAVTEQPGAGLTPAGGVPVSACGRSVYWLGLCVVLVTVAVALG